MMIVGQFVATTRRTEKKSELAQVLLIVKQLKCGGVG